MQLRNEFRAGLPAETAWQILTGVERIAACLPGAQLFEIEGEDQGPEVEPVDILPIIARSLIKRVLPVVGAIGLVVVVRKWRHRDR
ncbi:MAG: hypothetical protein ACRDZ8_00530 [Acidimicrobiales bacterium]